MGSPPPRNQANCASRAAIASAVVSRGGTRRSDHPELYLYSLQSAITRRNRQGSVRTPRFLAPNSLILWLIWPSG